jgi:hypothetical protein
MSHLFKIVIVLSLFATPTIDLLSAKRSCDHISQEEEKPVDPNNKHFRIDPESVAAEITELEMQLSIELLQAMHWNNEQSCGYAQLSEVFNLAIKLSTLLGRHERAQKLTLTQIQYAKFALSEKLSKENIDKALQAIQIVMKI